MEELILQDFETFEEIPNGLLLVTEKTDLMYIKTDNDVFIAREFLDSVSGDDSTISYLISYHDVQNKQNVLTINITKDINENVNILNQNPNIQIIPLNVIFNIKGNSKIYLNIEDLKPIIDFKEEEPKEKRKYYF